VIRVGLLRRVADGILARQGHWLGGAVKAGVARVAHVRIKRHAAAVPPPVLGAMRGRAEMQTMSAGSARDLADNVSLWAHS